jgi:D-glycerate 3-kinase
MHFSGEWSQAIVSLDAASLIEREALSCLDASRTTVIMGICGAQGSGKSTACSMAARRLNSQNVRTVILSLDDLYLTKNERVQLAADVHPLLQTRGVPGTHDVALGCEILDSLRSGAPTRLPRFDKAVDDRKAEALWERVHSPVQIVLFEGWCIGAAAQSPEALVAPVNALESDQDAAQTWRRYVNCQLEGSYRELWARIPHLVLLAAPCFEIVKRWRMEQEMDLEPAKRMSVEQVGHFVQHYERITRHLLDELPARANCVAMLDADRKILEVR